MASKLMMLGIAIYFVQMIVNRFFYKIPEPVYIGLMLIACALMLFGIIFHKKSSRK